MTIADSLRAISLYPLNRITIENIAEECGFNADDTISVETRNSSAYKKAKAQVYLYLAEAPDVTEANMHFAFTDEDRRRFRNKAAELLAETGEDIGGSLEVGYLGEDF